MSEGTPARISRHTRLDSYVDRYATRTQGMTAFEIRALFAVAQWKLSLGESREARSVSLPR